MLIECSHCLNTSECSCNVCLSKAGIERGSVHFAVVECSYCKGRPLTESPMRKFETKECPHCKGARECGCARCYRAYFDYDADDSVWSVQRRGRPVTCMVCEGSGRYTEEV